MDGSFASELYLVPAAGGEARNITRYATCNFGMSWSGDGKQAGLPQPAPRQDLDVFVLSMQKPAAEGDAPQPPTSTWRTSTSASTASPR